MRIQLVQGDESEWFVKLLDNEGSVESTSEAYSGKAAAKKAVNKMFPDVKVEVVSKENPEGIIE